MTDHLTHIKTTEWQALLLSIGGAQAERDRLIRENEALQAENAGLILENEALHDVHDLLLAANARAEKAEAENADIKQHWMKWCDSHALEQYEAMKRERDEARATLQAAQAEIAQLTAENGALYADSFRALEEKP
jgi:regulator of replication initiation timing